ncbi:MAG: GNAT family N-acetyltransferase [Dehalococcoidia bacterium]
MSIEIRPIVEAERPRRDFIANIAFAAANRPPHDSALWLPLDWTLGAFVEGELGATMVTIPFVTWINGAPLPLGGVSAVACLPEYRRQGLTSAMLRQSLRDMRDRGQLLSGLFTPHLPLYVRFGWEPATFMLTHNFDAKQVALRRPPNVRGRLLRATPGDWPRLDAAWRAYIAQQNGLFERTEEWWRVQVFGEEGDSQARDLVVWADESGDWQGWLCFRELDIRPAKPGTRLQVRELVARTDEAYMQLLTFMLRHDLVVETEFRTTPDDPFRALLLDPRPVQSTLREQLLLRIVDLPGALAARACLATDPMRVTIQVTDTEAPWNDGIWKIRADGGRLQAQPASGTAEASITINGLATLFNGHLRAATARRAGLLQTADPTVLTRLDALFAVGETPRTPDGF